VSAHARSVSTSTLIASTGGVRIALHDFGGPDDPTAPILLFAHATGFHGRAWEPVASLLTDRYRCIAIDLRGHGVSDTPDDASLSWRFMGDDVLAAVDSDLIGGRRDVHGIGHSLGCAALVLAASRRPGLLRSLWLYEPAIVGPAVIPRSGSSNPMVDRALRRRASFASYDEALANFAGKPPLNELHPDALAAYVRGGFAPQPDGTVTLRCTPAAEAAVFRGGDNSEAFEALSSLDMPVALVAGRPEALGPVTFVPSVLAQLSRGTLVERRHLGHFGPLEDPTGIGRDIAAWVEANR
jgi:pimeloyl-ACP methyl ester carboxylesterase